MLRLHFKIPANQLQILRGKEHFENRCWEVSDILLQSEHIEGKWHPLCIKLSSVGSLFSMNLQTINDFEGGKLGDQISLAQFTLGK